MESRSHLTVLDLSSTAVTDGGLSKVATGLLDLARLYLTNTQVSEGGLSRYLDQRPHVQVRGKIIGHARNNM